jgi:hypothetical protein
MARGYPKDYDAKYVKQGGTTMKKLILAIAACAGFSGTALANDTMDAMIGLSVTYDYPDGASVSAAYSADGSYTTDSVGGGKWTMSGDELCITTDDGASGCTTLSPGKGSGDSWEASDAFGNDVTITIE